MKKSYRVWDPADGDRDDSGSCTIEAHDPDDAAAEYAEQRHSDYDYPSSFDLRIADPDGNEWDVHVSCEPSIDFNASEPVPRSKP